MAKKTPSAKPTSRTVTKPAWQTRWPQNGDLAAWLRCGVDKCQSIPTLQLCAEKMHLPIRGLAELGHQAEALKILERMMKKLATTDFAWWVRSVRLAADICVNADDIDGFLRYLDRLQAASKKSTKKSEHELVRSTTYELQLAHGLVEPDDLASEEHQIEAAFNRARRLVRGAITARNKKSTAMALEGMWHATNSITGWRKRQCVGITVSLAHQQGHPKLVQQIIDSIPKKDRADLLGLELLVQLGLKSEAKSFAVTSIKASLDELRSMNDPNIHFPIQTITDGLMSLIRLDEKQTARTWFKQTADSVKKWKCVLQGWTTTAVLTSFVPVVEILEGQQAAQELAQMAHEHASSETHSGFKQGALSSATRSFAAVNSFDEAIAKAQRIRSAPARRMELARLFAKNQRWRELKAICSQSASPLEAAEIAWQVKFELPGGAV